MDLGTTIIGLIVIVMCIVPFIIVSSRRRKRDEEIIQSLNDVALKENKKVSLYELWNESIIGLEESETMVFVIRRAKENTAMQTIQLSEMLKCRLINDSRGIRNAPGSTFVIERLALALVNKEKNKAETIIDFYNVERDSLSLSGELQLAEKWNKLLNEKILALQKNNTRKLNVL